MRGTFLPRTVYLVPDSSAPPHLAIKDKGTHVHFCRLDRLRPIESGVNRLGRPVQGMFYPMEVKWWNHHEWKNMLVRRKRRSWSRRPVGPPDITGRILVTWYQISKAGSSIVSGIECFWICLIELLSCGIGISASQSASIFDISFSTFIVFFKPPKGSAMPKNLCIISRKSEIKAPKKIDQAIR